MHTSTWWRAIPSDARRSPCGSILPQRLHRRRRRELDSRAAYAPRSCRGRHMRIAYVLPRGCCPWRQAPHRCVAAAIRCREGRISLTSHPETTSSFSVPWAAMASGPTRSDSRISLSPSHRGVPEAHRRALPIHVDPLHAPQISNRGGNQGSIITASQAQTLAAPSSSLSTSRSASGIPPSRVGRHLGRASCPALQVVAPAGYKGSSPRRQASESWASLDPKPSSGLTPALHRRRRLLIRIFSTSRYAIA